MNKDTIDQMMSELEIYIEKGGFMDAWEEDNYPGLRQAAVEGKASVHQLAKLVKIHADRVLLEMKT